MKSTKPRYPISYSAMQKYLRCPASYDYHYNQRIRPKYIGSSLILGIAVDNAVNLILQKFPKSVQSENIEKVLIEGIMREPLGNVEPSKKDWDIDLYNLVNEKRKTNLLKLWNLGDVSLDEFVLGLLDKQKLKKSEAIILDALCRECLIVKAKFMIEAYQRDILPKIKNVISTQERLKNGIIDAEIEYVDGVTRITDNKTSTGLYAEDQTEFSMQLTMYSKAKKNENVAYLIMNKSLIKEKIKTCKACGAVNKSTHQTCPEVKEIEGKKVRCHGEFNIEVKIKAETQTVFGKVTKRMRRVAAETVKHVKKAIKACIFPCNFDQCNNQFGKPCDYRDLKWKGSMKGLKKV